MHSLPLALSCKLGLSNPRQFHSKRLACGYLVLPNSCFMASKDEREKRSRIGETIRTSERHRDGEITEKEQRQGDGRTEGHKGRGLKHVRPSTLA